MNNDTNMPSQLIALKTLISQAGLTHDIFTQILQILEMHEVKLYACREDVKLCRASAASADRRCAEALYKLADIQKVVRKNQGA